MVEQLKRINIGLFTGIDDDDPEIGSWVEKGYTRLRQHLPRATTGELFDWVMNCYLSQHNRKDIQMMEVEFPKRIEAEKMRAAVNILFELMVITLSQKAGNIR